MTNWTAERLASLRPGEKFTYYRGDLDADIRRAGTPYSDVLIAVRNAAAELARAGKIDVEVIEQRNADGRPGRSAATYVYVATGRRP